MTERVVVTGIGPITACGIGMDALWEAMIAGRSAIAPIQAFDAGHFACQVAAELPEEAFNVRKIVPKSYRKATKVMCRDIELAVGAADAAVSDAGLVTRGTDADADPSIPPERFGCHIGAGLIAAEVEELCQALVTSRAPDGEFDIAHWGNPGMENLTPLWLLKYLPNMLACHVTIVHDCQGPSNTITCCEASSALSLAESMRVIERGAADACLTGGAEYKLNPMAFLRQDFANRLAPSEGQDPTAVARPFDASATGTVLGEGGGLLVIESASSAESRGATAKAVVSGLGITQSFCPDTVGIDIPADDPSLEDAVRIALESAELEPGAIDAIVPFGSSIPSVDAAEASAIRGVFGDRASAIPLVTTVPYVGNCCAGNGAIGLCVGVKCLMEQTLPGRLNTASAEGLEASASETRSAELNHVLVMTSSQGGQNAAVVLSRA